MHFFCGFFVPGILTGKVFYAGQFDGHFMPGSLPGITFNEMTWLVSQDEIRNRERKRKFLSERKRERERERVR